MLSLLLPLASARSRFLRVSVFLWALKELLAIASERKLTGPRVQCSFGKI